MDTRGDTEMIKELTIECEEIMRVETNHNLGNNIRVTLLKLEDNFFLDLEVKEIVQGLDANDTMQALADIYGLDFIRDWVDGLGK